jgi:hypothetical protein
VAGEIDPSSLANASLKDVAEVINSIMPVVETPDPIKKLALKRSMEEKTTSNLNSPWVRDFSVEYVTEAR